MLILSFQITFSSSNLSRASFLFFNITRLEAPFLCLSVRLSVCLPILQSIIQSIRLSTCPSICQSVRQSVCHTCGQRIKKLGIIKLSLVSRTSSYVFNFFSSHRLCTIISQCCDQFSFKPDINEE